MIRFAFSSRLRCGPAPQIARTPKWRLGATLLAGAVLLAGCGDADAPTLPATSSPDAVIEKAGNTTADVYRFAKQSNGAYFYTGSAGERDIILASYPDFRYEGVAFQQYTGARGTPVFRFANLANGGYFYTASVSERDLVRGTRPDMRYEGTTFSVVTPASPGALAVHRLANLNNGAYLYTTQAGERDQAMRLGIWRSEGTAFHAPGPSGAHSCPDDALFANGTCVCNVSGYRYDTVGNVCVLPASPEEPIRMASGWAGDYVDGGGGDAGGDGGASGVGAGSSLGIVKGARVEIYRPKDGALVLAASGLTDPVKGMVTVQRGTYTGPVLAVFKGQAGATYYDESLRTEIEFPEGRELNVMLASLGANFAATPLTDAAFQYALQIYGDPRVSRETNLVRILTPQRIQVASDLVRNQMNAMLPTSMQVSDIARLPYLIGPGTTAGTVPNTPNGRYALVLSALAIAAKSYNDALLAARVPGAARSPAPASAIALQLASDLTDGRLDTYAGNAPVADFSKRLYSLSVAELTALDLPTSLTLPAALAAGLQASIASFASPTLAQAIGVVTIPPPTVAPPPPTTGSACSGTQYPLPGGGTGCCPSGSTVQVSASPTGIRGVVYYCSTPPTATQVCDVSRYTRYDGLLVCCYSTGSGSLCRVVQP